MENVLIYQERQSEEDDAEIVVKIFVEFGHPSHAKVVCERVFEKYQLSSLYRREERVCTGGFLAGGPWWPPLARETSRHTTSRAGQGGQG